MSIRRTDARRTQTLTRDQGNGIRDLALFPFLRTLSSFYVRFMRYVSVLYLTLTSFRFRDERRQRGARVTRTPSAVEEPPSRSRALFHPSSSFHYLILFALSCNSYPLISTHIPFDPHSTSMLVPPSLSSGASRCSRGSTPHRSLVMLATALLHQDLSFYPSMVCWALALHTHTTWFPSPPSGAVLAL